MSGRLRDAVLYDMHTCLADIDITDACSDEHGDAAEKCMVASVGNACELSEAAGTCDAIKTACDAVDANLCVALMQAFKPAAHQEILDCIDMGKKASTDPCEDIVDLCIWDPWAFY
ncbi:MAG TPA: hypothetical protein PKW66_22860 [Polyangiaceae bacterium]|nr:hypothetical protein [Polyangiaceae bacterium]